VRPAQLTQRQALAVGRHGAQVDRRRHARGRRQFRRIIGYRDLARLAVAIERNLDRTTAPSPTVEEAATLATA